MNQWKKDMGSNIPTKNEHSKHLIDTHRNFAEKVRNAVALLPGNKHFVEFRG